MYETEKLKHEVHIYLGTLLSPENYPADFHVHVKEKLSWFRIDDDTKQYETLP